MRFLCTVLFFFGRLTLAQEPAAGMTQWEKERIEKSLQRIEQSLQKHGAMPPPEAGNCSFRTRRLSISVSERCFRKES